jgi:predicted RNA-binding Zn ribbon-like protein
MLASPLSERPAALAKQVAGRPCLDFANLVKAWTDQTQALQDRLTEYADLLGWSWNAGLLGEAATARLWRESQQRPREAAAVLQRARRLRDSIHAIAWAFEKGRPQSRTALDAVADEARVARSHQVLEASKGRLEWRLPDGPPALDAPLWPVALSAESYFTSADLTRLHSCPGEECGWHFEDATRNRSRQWCDMGDCGNLAKVRRFRSRQRKGRTRGSSEPDARNRGGRRAPA